MSKKKSANLKVETAAGKVEQVRVELLKLGEESQGKNRSLYTNISELLALAGRIPEGSVQYSQLADEDKRNVANKYYTTTLQLHFDLEQRVEDDMKLLGMFRMGSGEDGSKTIRVGSDEVTTTQETTADELSKMAQSIKRFCEKDASGMSEEDRKDYYEKVEEGCFSMGVLSRAKVVECMVMLKKMMLGSVNAAAGGAEGKGEEENVQRATSELSEFASSENASSCDDGFSLTASNTEFDIIDLDSTHGDKGSVNTWTLATGIANWKEGERYTLNPRTRAAINSEDFGTKKKGAYAALKWALGSGTMSTQHNTTPVTTLLKNVLVSLNFMTVDENPYRIVRDWYARVGAVEMLTDVTDSARNILSGRALANLGQVRLLSMVKEAERLMKQFKLASKELEGELTLEGMLRQALISQMSRATEGTSTGLAMESVLGGIFENAEAVLEKLSVAVPTFGVSSQEATFKVNVVAAAGKGAWMNGAPVTNNGGAGGTKRGDGGVVANAKLSASENELFQRLSRQRKRSFTRDLALMINFPSSFTEAQKSSLHATRRVGLLNKGQQARLFNSIYNEMSGMARTSKDVLELFQAAQWGSGYTVSIDGTRIASTVAAVRTTLRNVDKGMIPLPQGLCDTLREALASVDRDNGGVSSGGAGGFTNGGAGGYTNGSQYGGARRFAANASQLQNGGSGYAQQQQMVRRQQQQPNNQQQRGMQSRGMAQGQQSRGGQQRGGMMPGQQRRNEQAAAYMAREMENDYSAYRGYNAYGGNDNGTGSWHGTALRADATDYEHENGQGNDDDFQRKGTAADEEELRNRQQEARLNQMVREQMAVLAKQLGAEL